MDHVLPEGWGLIFLTGAPLVCAPQGPTPSTSQNTREQSSEVGDSKLYPGTSLPRGSQYSRTAQDLVGWPCWFHSMAPRVPAASQGTGQGPLKSLDWVTTSPSPGSPSATSEKQPPPPCLAPTVQGHHIFPASATTNMSHELKQPFNVPVVVTAHFFPLRGLTISPFMPGSSWLDLATSRLPHGPQVLFR